MFFRFTDLLTSLFHFEIIAARTYIFRKGRDWRHMIDFKPGISTFFMFNGKAEEAIRFYISLFNGSEIKSLHHHPDGTVLHAIFTLQDQTYMAIDNSLKIEHPFTPAMSLFVSFETEEEIDSAYAKLMENGKALMALDASPFSAKFAWVEDRFGVSWQLNLPSPTA